MSAIHDAPRAHAGIIPLDGEPATTSLPRVPARGQYTEAARRERLAWLRTHTASALTALDATRLTPERLTGNVENLIGAVEIPVGLAGPLLFLGEHARGMICAPYATSEGALVASATRGATALSRAGGVSTRVLAQRMTRAPAFVLGTLADACALATWLGESIDEIRERVALVSRHARLVALEPAVIGATVHVDFCYETAEAAGQNMTTACTWHACQWILGEVARRGLPRVQRFYIEANLSGDKKVTARSFVRGRGMRVAAECTLPHAVLEQVLKVTPGQLLQAHEVIAAGSAHAGMVGYDINVANTVAAIFTATGQDIACVHESSVAQLEIRAAAGGVHASMLLPAVIVGTVGGGTHLPAQRDLLEAMGCAGEGGSRRLAEIIAGYALALDLSTMAAVATGEFARAHERLGRSRPVRAFTREELGPEFFQPLLRDAMEDPALSVEQVTDAPRALGSSIITELTARKTARFVGLLPLRLHARRGDGSAWTPDVVVKSKPLDAEVALMANGLAAMCGARLASAHDRFRHRTGFAGCHLRELGVYAQTDPRFRAHAPRAYGIVRDDARELHLLVLESLHDAQLLDSADDLRGWTDAHVAAAVRGIAAVHSIWLGREAELRVQPWLGDVMTGAEMVELQELWRALADHAAREFPALVPPAALRRLLALADSVGDWWPRLEARPRTLIHNDFNPRNVAFRATPNGPRLCAYDWELATLGAPQHDLAELLCFVLRPDVSRAAVDRWVELHRLALEHASGRTLDRAHWREGYQLALQDLAINRIPMYLMAHTFRHYAFMERVVGTLWRLLAIELDERTPDGVARTRRTEVRP